MSYVVFLCKSICSTPTTYALPVYSCSHNPTYNWMIYAGALAIGACYGGVCGELVLDVLFTVPDNLHGRWSSNEWSTKCTNALVCCHCGGTGAVGLHIKTIANFGCHQLPINGPSCTGEFNWVYRSPLCLESESHHGISYLEQIYVSYDMLYIYLLYII